MASPGPIIARERNVQHGTNGFYDIALRRTGERDLRIEVEMSIFFDFVPNPSDSTIRWSDSDKSAFRSAWLQQIPDAWDQTRFTSHKGQQLSLAFVCNIRAAPGDTQWQARVAKLKDRSAFRTSAVARNYYEGNFDAKFDSNDDLRKPLGDRTQTAMIHEFGHMIGEPDEYKETSDHHADKGSIMNIGSAVRPRHLEHFVAWAGPHITALGVEGAMDDRTAKDWLEALTSAPSADEEMAAAQAWRDSLGPDDELHFSVRRRDTQEPVPTDRLSTDSFDEYEIVFLPAEGEESEPMVWQPQSREALEILFLE